MFAVAAGAGLGFVGAMALVVLFGLWVFSWMKASGAVFIAVCGFVVVPLLLQTPPWIGLFLMVLTGGGIAAIDAMPKRAKGDPTPPSPCGNRARAWWEPYSIH